MAGETLTLLEEAKQLASKGELTNARDKFQKAAEEASAEEQHETERDAILGMAESQWQLGETGGALLSYEAALSATRKAKDEAGEGMVLLGKGFALMSLGRGPAACEAFETSASIAERNGHAAQKKFALDLLQQAKLLPAGPAAEHQHSAHCDHSSAESKAEEEKKEGAVGVSGERGGAGVASSVVARAFVRSFVGKEALVLVMKGSPAAPKCGFSLDAAKALYGVGAVYRHLDVWLQPELEGAFKAEFQWPTFPMLFANGTLFGGRDILSQLAEEGSLEAALREALAPLPADQLDALFGAEGVEPGAGGGGGESGAGKCQSEHEARLRRMVLFTAASVCGQPAAYDPATADDDATKQLLVEELLAKHSAHAGSNSTSQQLVEAFLAQLSEALGGFEFPATVLSEAGSVGALVGWVEEHCPAKGDCKACPTRHSCTAHHPDAPHNQQLAAQDIEDLEGVGGGMCGVAKRSHPTKHPHPLPKKHTPASPPPEAPEQRAQAS